MLREDADELVNALEQFVTAITFRDQDNSAEASLDCFQRKDELRQLLEVHL